VPVKQVAIIEPQADDVAYHRFCDVVRKKKACIMQIRNMKVAGFTHVCHMGIKFQRSVKSDTKAFKSDDG